MLRPLIVKVSVLFVHLPLLTLLINIYITKSPSNIKELNEYSNTEKTTTRKITS